MVYFFGVYRWNNSLYFYEDWMVRMNTRKLILSEVNDFGVLFQIHPLISLEMDANQIKAERLV